MLPGRTLIANKIDRPPHDAEIIEPLAMPRVFVTGAAGFVGRHVCQLMLSQGHAVHALIRRDDMHLRGMGVAISMGDLWDGEALEKAANGADIVVHCAGNPRFGNGEQYHRDNVELTTHLIQAIRRACPGLQRLVLVSTIGAIDRQASDPCTDPVDERTTPAPSSDYGRSKLMAEHQVRASGLPHVIIRPTMVVGPDMRPDSHFAVFARAALGRSPFSSFAWPGKLSVLHVDDLASAISLLSTHPEAQGNTYFCAGEAAAINDCFELARPHGARIPLAWASKLMAPLSRWAPFSLKALLLPALTASDARLRQLGWTPRHDARTTLLQIIDRESMRLDPSVPPDGWTVITGAASGLGHALVTLLAPMRRHLLLIDRDSDGLAAIQKQHPHCSVAVVDLSHEESIEELMNGPAWRSRPVAELFACAGIGLKGTMQALPYQAHRNMFVVNVLARIFLAQRAATDMQRQGWGRIVLISSSSAFQPLPSMGTYAATNSALLSLGEAWSHELKAQGVHLMTVCPGGMQTNFQRNNGVRELENEKLMPAEEVAALILKGLSSQRTTLVVSFRSFAMSMLARLLPRSASLALWARLMEKMR